MDRFQKKPVDDDVDIGKLVELTERYTGADIAAITDAATISSIKEHVIYAEKKEKDDKKKQEKQGLKISMRHFETAIQKIKRKTNAIFNPSLI